MIYTTSGNKNSRAINAETVKEQIIGLLISNGENPDKVEALKQILEVIDELPTIDTLDGKKMRKAHYPRIMVKDNCQRGSKPRRVGENTHHTLEVRHTERGSYICFVDVQGMVGTDFAEDGYTFVGEKPFEDAGDDTEVIPFDEVWIEE